MSPLFIAFVVGNSDHIAVAKPDRSHLPVIIGLFVLLGVISFVPLPKLRRLGRDNKRGCLKTKRVSAYTSNKHSIFNFTFGSWFFGNLLLCWCRNHCVRDIVIMQTGRSQPSRKLFVDNQSLVLSLRYRIPKVSLTKHVHLQICSLVALAGTALVVFLPNVSIYCIGMWL